ncbi:MAG TPA: hypothetical protein VL634_24435 [Mycobacterium sp.]|jgi:hypothetical protein|nr:hypothetical protein [Mycobacterium sp.]
MGLLLVRLVELLIVLVPVIGVGFAGYKALSAARGRQAQGDDGTVTAKGRAANSQAALWRSISRTVAEHDRTDTRWLDYELDIGKLLDFPLMTDMRNPLTERFHRAKLRADLLRPAKAEELLEDPEAARQYLDAVENYVTAFDVAESEAIRRRRSDFTKEQQQRITRARSALRVAVDAAATPQERDQAYALACRELDGLVVLPERARAAIERGIAGELGGPA